MADDEQQQPHEGCSYFDTVPEEILVEVLVRLRVKLLLCCKSVSKHWLSLIESPGFVSKHMHYQKRKGSNLLLRLYHPINTDHAFFTWMVRLARSVRDNSTEYEVIGQCEYPGRINGPVNGFFCLNSNKGIGIWNPSTSEVMLLSRPKSNHRLYISKASLGLDPRSNSADDFKVLHVAQYERKDDSVEEADSDEDRRNFIASYMLYSLRSKSWKHIKTLTDLPQDNELPCFRDSGTYLDGVYYWWHAGEVISFDMVKDVFQDNIPGPRGVKGLIQGIFSFLDDDTRVCLYNQQTVEANIDIWVMERVSNCWTKLASTVLPCGGYWYPPSYTRSNGIILYDRDYSIRWNPITKEIMKLQRCEYFDYSESLVSVKGRELAGIRIGDHYLNIEDHFGSFEFQRW